jgi:hypothetical protein
MMHRSKESVSLAIAVTALVSAGAFALARQNTTSQPPASLHDAPPPNTAPGMQAGPDLVGGLRQSPGCLGVEVARTMSGKDVIFAWFKDKKAVEAWYDSEMHQQAMKQFFPGEHGRPMAGVPDDIGPIMAIASVTMSDKANFGETNLPVSQISIELYAPVTGGLYLGGRFAPESLKVKGMEDYTLETPEPSDSPKPPPATP